MIVIDKIAIRNFRCFENITLNPHKDLNIIVGENGAGKSSIFTALDKLFEGVNTKNNNCINDLDIRWGDLTGNKELFVKCTLSLDADKQLAIMNPLFQNRIGHTDWLRVFERISSFLQKVEIGFNWKSSKNLELMLGTLSVIRQNLSIKQNPGNSQKPIDDLFQILATAQLNNSVQGILGSIDLWNAPNVIQDEIYNIIQPKFYTFAEFRVRPDSSKRDTGLDSFQGSQTASVLLNLKNHTRLYFRNRYKRICEEFSNFFPFIYIDAIETAPGSGIADVQFIQKSNDYPIPLANVGAGMVELLTFITNLVASNDRIFVVEEPESHLHPHAKRRLQKLILEASEKNQVFVITHDPYFVQYNRPKVIFRFANTDNGTQIHFLPKNTDSKLEGQIKTALQNISKREQLFARALLIVEDESHRQFILGCADKLSYDLDSAGLSIIEVGGKDGYQPYIKIAECFNIPFLCLEDLTRGPSKKRPKSIFRSLGCELEDYLKQYNLGGLMEEAKSKVGTGKQRVARYCGEHVDKDKIPDFFKTLIEDAVALCK
ncbi:ATP-dependent endonuclease [Chloroflexota bacterium]